MVSVNGFTVGAARRREYAVEFGKFVISTTIFDDGLLKTLNRSGQVMQSGSLANIYRVAVAEDVKGVDMLVHRSRFATS
jgi:hypothetical protein